LIGKATRRITEIDHSEKHGLASCLEVWTVGQIAQGFLNKALIFGDIFNWHFSEQLAASGAPVCECDPLRRRFAVRSTGSAETANVRVGAPARSPHGAIAGTFRNEGRKRFRVRGFGELPFRRHARSGHRRPPSGLVPVARGRSLRVTQVIPKVSQNRFAAGPVDGILPPWQAALSFRCARHDA
jgi:hypothetical protein